MHEMSAAQGIIEMAEQAAQDNDCTIVHKVTLCIGEISCIQAESLKFCFDILKDGTVAQHAELAIEAIPAMLRCSQCGTQFKAGPGGVCPACASKGSGLISGNEFFVKDIEAE